jgi:hypothetical protein
VENDLSDITTQKLQKAFGADKKSTIGSWHLRYSNGMVNSESKIRVAALLVLVSVVSISFVWSSIYPPRSWGLSEYLINYSGGFVRRGLPGTILLEIYQNFNITPRVALHLILFPLIGMIIYLTFRLLMNVSFLTNVVFLIVLLNPSLVLFVTSQDTLLRKDWFISFGLLIHGYYSLLVAKEKISNRHNLTFLGGLGVYLVAVSLAHEVNILFIPLHIFMILKNKDNFAYRGIWPASILLIIISQIIILVFVLKFNGNSELQFFLAENLPIALFPGLENHPAIEALGWSYRQNLEYVIAMLNIKTVLFYSLFLFFGPGVIYWKILRHSYASIKYITAYIVILQLFLLTLGWDWGRWISLISFSLLSLTPFVSHKSDVSKSNKGVDWLKERNLLVKKEPFYALIMLGIVTIQLPSFGPQESLYSSISNLIRIVIAISKKLIEAG